MASPLSPAAAGQRPAFDLFEGYALGSVMAALEMAGLLEALEGEGLPAGGPGGNQPSSALLEASLRYLVRRGLVEAAEGGHRLSEAGREVCRDKGYLLWLVGGYGQPLTQDRK